MRRIEAKNEKAMENETTRNRFKDIGRVGICRIKSCGLEKCLQQFFQKARGFQNSSEGNFKIMQKLGGDFSTLYPFRDIIAAIKIDGSDGLQHSLRFFCFSN